ncbi:hypothetical protein M0812_08123 [Anaeramoeba flamelloides]|uniref:Transmembrane protein n=1 Tax=Anaeramoeba flamelloides TaxID=1746091 RepID=A0AAV8A227_9EUKA|nr:hypothetical protein M0812_08123 [Anaeramoeba flamelloides]
MTKLSSQKILSFLILFILFYRLTDPNLKSRSEIGKTSSGGDHKEKEYYVQQSKMEYLNQFQEEQKQKTNDKIQFFCLYNKEDPKCQDLKEETKIKLIIDKTNDFRKLPDDTQIKMKIQFTKDYEEIKHFPFTNSRNLNNYDRKVLKIDPKFLDQIHLNEKKNKDGTLLISVLLIVFVLFLILAKIKYHTSKEKKHNAAIEQQNALLGPASENLKNELQLIEIQNPDQLAPVPNHHQQQFQHPNNQNNLRPFNQNFGNFKPRESSHKFFKMSLLFFVFCYLALYFSEFSNLNERKFLIQQQYDLQCLGGFDQKITYYERIKYRIKPRTLMQDKEKFINECWEMNQIIQSNRPSLGRPIEVFVEEAGNTFEIVMSKIGSGIGEFTKSIFTSIGFKNLLQLVFLLLFANILLNLLPFFK